MEPDRAEDTTRANLAGTPVCTADEQRLGVVAAVVGKDLVVRGKAPARRVHVLPVSAVSRWNHAVVYLNRTMAEVLQHVRRALHGARDTRQRGGS